MPKLGRYAGILDSVFFLYETPKDAELGVNPQASGFLVAIPCTDRQGYIHIHGITNWHVAVEYLPAPCIRINTHSGEPKIFDFDASEWTFQEGFNDVAISPPLLIDFDSHKAVPLDVSSFFLTAEEEKRDEIGPGDDVFMVGLFVNDFSKEVDSPALRFGHISIMDAQIKQPTQFKGRSVVLDMNSRTGFSGSPVFIYRTLGSHFIEQAKPGQFLTGGGHYMKLLGIHWGQFPEAWEMKNLKIETKDKKVPLLADETCILGVSGMTCVVPAVAILELLDLAELKSTRTEKNCVRAPPYTQ